MNTSLILLVVLSLILSVKALYDADEIVNLPGAEHLEISFKQYSGYLQIPGVSGALTKNMHYWFTQSTTDTFNSPLTFWTNGGALKNITIIILIIFYHYHYHYHHHLIRPRMFWFDWFHD
jgi:hypothetical protein